MCQVCRAERFAVGVFLGNQLRESSPTGASNSI
jgi:hypothetical protein